jgi:hypothetical protein
MLTVRTSGGVPVGDPSTEGRDHRKQAVPYYFLPMCYSVGGPATASPWNSLERASGPTSDPQGQN